MTWSRATAIAGSAVVTLVSCRIRIVRGHHEPSRDCRTMAPGVGWLRPANQYSLSRRNTSRASKLSSFTHRPQTGNWWRKLTASGGSFRFRNFRWALTLLPNICELTRV